VLNDNETEQTKSPFLTDSGWFISDYAQDYERESNLGKMLHPLSEEFSVIKSQLMVQAVYGLWCKYLFLKTGLKQVLQK